MSQRQPAVRIFAGEYNDSQIEVRDEGQYSPNFVVSPLGAMVNRLFLVGVLLEVSEVGNPEEPFTIGRVSDPSGSAFRISAGSKKPEMAEAMKKLKTPSFVAVVGKSDLYNPEPGVYRLSVDPEVIHPVEDKDRLHWILETAKSTKERIEAVIEAKKMAEPSEKEMKSLGFSDALSRGAVEAVENYSTIDTAKYAGIVMNALSFILPEYRSELPVQEETPVEQKAPTSDGGADGERTIMKIITELAEDNEEGASWEDIVDEAKKRGLEEMDVEEAYVALRDKGLIMEPSIGMLKPA